jgi:hypothetical protein
MAETKATTNVERFDCAEAGVIVTKLIVASPVVVEFDFLSSTKSLTSTRALVKTRAR